MWVFSNISSPYLFDTWDYDIRFSPHLSFPAYRALFSNKYYIDVQNYILSYDFTATGHMPLGSISFSLGFGGVYTYGEDSLNNDFSNFSSLIHVGLAYSAFVTERVFFRIAFDSYSPLKNKTINNKHLKIFLSIFLFLARHLLSIIRQLMNRPRWRSA